jgi:Ala-tRNA(Pro) deacylase
MESILGAKIGAATVFGVLMDKESLVQVVFDNDVPLDGDMVVAMERQLDT